MIDKLTIDVELMLSSVSEADASQLFTLVDKNRAHLRAWLPWLDFNEKASDTLEFIQRSIKQAAENSAWVTLIHYKSTLVGVIGFNYINHLHRTCEIGYWLDKEHQGHGIVTRCVKGLIDYAFTELHLNKVNIGVATANVGSRAIPERLGFDLEGTSKDAEWLYDHFVDHALYAMRAAQWTDA